MVFDPILGRGVRKRYLHEPNPTRVKMKRESSYEDVLKRQYHFFLRRIYNPDLDSLSLADSTGMPINVASCENWTLGAFYRNNGLQPSRYKLYVVIQYIIVMNAAVYDNNTTPHCTYYIVHLPSLLMLSHHFAFILGR